MPCTSSATSFGSQYWQSRLVISELEALRVSEMLGERVPGAQNTMANFALEKLVELVASDPEPAFWLYTLLVSQLPAERKETKNPAHGRVFQKLNQ